MNESRRFAAFVCDALESSSRKVKGDKRKGLFFRSIVLNLWLKLPCFHV